jgi:hypothetical protein
MPKDLASFLLRRSVRRVRDDQPRCHDCRRAPLTGELMHVSDDRVLCSLCLVRVPEEKRDGLESRRVHASQRPLAVVRRAA